MEKYLSPSILSADFTRITDALRAIESGGADWVHCDVMDGMFVPNISFGQKMVADIKRETRITVDAHLMIVEPIRYIEEFAKYADIITFHVEAVVNPLSTINKIKACGRKAGLAIKPGTSIKTVLPFLGLIDMTLVMSVEPGFGGQKFMPESLEKIRELRKIAGNELIIQVDGGINENNIGSVIQAGANSVVAGNIIFSSSKPREKTSELKKML